MHVVPWVQLLLLLIYLTIDLALSSRFPSPTFLVVKASFRTFIDLALFVWRSGISSVTSVSHFDKRKKVAAQSPLSSGRHTASLHVPSQACSIALRTFPEYPISHTHFLLVRVEDENTVLFLYFWVSTSIRN